MPTPQTPLVPNESIPVRFRDRVRSRVGSGDLFVFRVGDERFACDVRAVEEVLESPTLYPVPGVAGPVVGVCQHAGRTLHVVETAAILGVEGKEARTVLVMRRGHAHLGLLVDDVEDVRSLDLGLLRSPPYENDDLLLAVHWDGNELLAVLDARAVIAAASAASQLPA